MGLSKKRWVRLSNWQAREAARNDESLGPTDRLLNKYTFTGSRNDESLGPIDRLLNNCTLTGSRNDESLVKWTEERKAGM